MSHPKHWIQRVLTAALTALLAISTAQADETVTYIHWDALGSPVAATDEDGNVVWREAYRPYGERINNEAAAGPHSRWYTGHPQDDDTRLVYAGARYYDPVIGRFLAIDPVDFQEDDLHSFNRYAYVSNNPYGYIDPDGRVKAADAWRSSGSGGSGAGSIENWGGAGLAGRIGATNPSAGGTGANVGVGRGTNAGSVTNGAKNKAPDFVVSPGGTAFPVPKGATGPTPVVNPGGKTTGSAFTGGKGGANGKVDTMRIMNPTPPRGKSPGYPNGYIKYENSASPKPQGVDPYTGKTLPNSQSHFPID